MISVWQTVYIQAALDHLTANGYGPDPADVGRFMPLRYPTINLDGRYRTTKRPPATGLRPSAPNLGSCTNPRAAFYGKRQVAAARRWLVLLPGFLR
jgi:hypothetical protein